MQDCIQSLLASRTINCCLLSWFDNLFWHPLISIDFPWSFITFFSAIRAHHRHDCSRTCRQSAQKICRPGGVQGVLIIILQTGSVAQKPVDNVNTQHMALQPGFFPPITGLHTAALTSKLSWCWLIADKPYSGLTDLYRPSEYLSTAHTLAVPQICGYNKVIYSTSINIYYPIFSSMKC